MPESMIGVIGGTGLGQALSSKAGGEEIHIDTPFGAPSSPITLTEWEGQKVAILQRHGSGHLLSPTEVPFRANIFALKKMGVTHIIASGATGSLREEIQPRNLVIVDQVIDRLTRGTAPFSTPASQPTWNSLSRFAARCAARCWPVRSKSRRKCMMVAYTSAWRDRSFRRWQSPSCTAFGEAI